MILHAIVRDSRGALRAARDGATVVQLRIKDVPTSERVRVGRAVLEALRGPTMLIVNDDVEAALELRVAVHLGQEDPGVARARKAGMAFGRSAGSVEEARRAEAEGALYIGAGPVWATPSKPDAGEAIGLDRLAAVCSAVSLPVVAIGGVDASNAMDCIAAGASGVAVIRAVRELRRLREVLDTALAERGAGVGEAR